MSCDQCEEPIVYDVVIIGGGPCGLAMAARLRESTPSAIFTDEEQRRYHWIKKHSGRMSIKNRKSLSTKAASRCSTSKGPSMLVLDGSGTEWMSRWNTLFDTFEIPHLRSPMFFHPDPKDRDSLLEYAHARGRASELVEIGGCVGQERTKNQRKKDRGHASRWKEPAIDERDRRDYFTPSTSLFRDYCEEVVDQYDLRGLIRQATVKDIDFDYVDQASENERIFSIKTNSTVILARTAVLSVGAGNVPMIPSAMAAGPIPGACHSMHIETFPDPSVRAKIVTRKATRVVVVGGGLTGAQLAVNAIRKGVARVHLILRSHLKVKPFDIDLSWMGKFRNAQQASFWSADTDEERWEQIREARGGGSITPVIHKTTKKLVAEGRLVIHTQTQITSREYDDSSQQWKIQTEPQIPDMPALDYIYFATGIATDFEQIPYLRTIVSKYKIASVGGLPCLTEDMAWSKNVPLFVTGRLASLRIGPGAANLAGARVSAERIAWSLQDLLDERRGAIDGLDEYAEVAQKYRDGVGGRFDSLVESDSSEE